MTDEKMALWDEMYEIYGYLGAPKRQEVYDYLMASRGDNPNHVDGAELRAAFYACGVLPFPLVTTDGAAEYDDIMAGQTIWEGL